MTRRVRTVYQWKGQPGSGPLEPQGKISEAVLRAWEYRAEPQSAWSFGEGASRDTVRCWKTARPDLRTPEELLVGDFEEVISH